ncbi:phosphoenolpyruvate--protein phosphotransferase [Marinitenerispora sediminis]|uniref:Phosphoenolpyruvate-protein phosphotransferase n=1 Tax=Marinitenerispora sediminis TaxID=1931232 RepID=A0A368T358_9ACTN|nr:phosphoenolpyruvate--protein phosphotransferase [Marinitenerispora sediminis]RCV55715.1 phosphoenolpyruvate--protein phosphotransferase [Marinitenerispora sediminis]RCV56736.1 phosphoenolpyruvate--protein phosphotransferase [Marinitenerispora sediminis]RCV56765.1 phosphoenolpyruvate--protein phosphotransferase [Marinitenerispora sediminis]
MSETLTGVGVSAGVGYGRTLRLTRSVPEPPAGSRHDGDVAAETRRAMAAVEETAVDLTERGERAGGEAKDVLTAQALMARDPALAGDVERRIAEGTAAARAVFDAFTQYRDMLANAGAYLAARVADLDDVRDRIVARLLGVPLPGIPESGDPFVLLAQDLAPADTALLDPERVLAFVTREGGPTSHTAILARALGLPAVVACEGSEKIADGAQVLVDGATGEVVVAPEPDVVERAEARAAARASAARRSRGPGRTADGHHVPLLANVGGPKDLPAALENGAEGVGLYRTEFLFLDRADAPTHEEQVAAYRAVLEAFPGAKVVVRTLDAGADKPLAFLPAPAEEPNPALGERGLRMMRLFPDMLDAQLAALAEAHRDTEADLQVMAPMVTDVEDTEWFAATAARAGIEQAGIMVEVPAAALRAAHLAESAAFFSIGTNDLTQYACAADREIGTLSRFQDPWQPGVVELVALTAAAAEGAGRPCGVCGEAAADPALACVLVGLGVSTLSMGAAALPMVRAALAAHTLEQCQAAATAVRAARTADDARRAARDALPGLADLGL